MTFKRFVRSPFALVIETDWFIPQRFDAYTYFAVVLVRPGQGEALIEHELTHARQFWRYWGTNGLRYRFSKKWRLRFELEAYRVQLALMGPAAAPAIAGSLSTKYNLGISIDEALQLLEAEHA
jgi:hypothetical protein